MDRSTQHLLRTLAPRVLGVILRRYRDFASSEDAVQEALLAAAMQWPTEGVPEDPRAWLVRVASRRVTDHVRAETALRLREALVVSLIPPEEQFALAADAPPEHDDSLGLLFLCCHPALSPAAAIALTLRAVGGLTTAEIARAFLVPEATMAQRLVRAKQSIRASGVPFGPPSPGEEGARLRSVMHVLYLIFNEGYAPTGGDGVHRVDLSAEAIRLCRMLLCAVSGGAGEPEVMGLLALMLLTDARRAARSGPLGELIPLDQQDRARWDRAAIEEGTALVTAALGRSAVGPYRVQAAIAALHDEAPCAEATDWRQILCLYDVLLALDEHPLVRLNRAVVLAMVEGPAAGLAAIEELAADARLAGHHRVAAARAHLLERAGDAVGAAAQYHLAAARTASTAERDYLLLRAAQLGAQT